MQSKETYNPYAAPSSRESDAIINAYELGYARGASVSYFQRLLFACFLLALAGAFFYCGALAFVQLCGGVQ